MIQPFYLTKINGIWQYRINNIEVRQSTSLDEILEFLTRLYS